MKVMIVVTHLLGTGHLSRALTLARAFAEAGDEVVVVSGGMPAPQLGAQGIRLLQLPPLRSDGTNFTRLLNDADTEADAALFAKRRQAILSALSDLSPDVLMTELFPFGRRVLSEEFLALLDAAHALPRRPVILCSIRDILAPPSKPARAARTEEIVSRYYDAVLVHSDPHTTPLSASWPVTRALAAKLRHTGYVAPPPAGPHPERAGDGEILVSAGGGAVGLPIFRAACQAAALLPDHRWRLLVGGGPQPLAEIRAIAAAGNVTVEPPRPDFRQMLHHAAALVSMCGYNTALDLLQAGTPAVLVPFDDGNEVEQTLRAQALAALPGIAVLRSAELAPERLARAVADAVAAPRRDATALAFDGAAQSVAIAHRMAGARA